VLGEARRTPRLTEHEAHAADEMDTLAHHRASRSLICKKSGCYGSLRWVTGCSRRGSMRASIMASRASLLRSFW
jgi:hypothetical protein